MVGATAYRLQGPRNTVVGLRNVATSTVFGIHLGSRMDVLRLVANMMKAQEKLSFLALEAEIGFGRERVDRDTPRTACFSAV